MLNRIGMGRTDLVFDWIEGGGDPQAMVKGAALIAWCAYYGDVSALRFLCRQGVALTTLGPNLDLNGAAFHGHWRLCDYLIGEGADPNRALADTGETPLHAALCRAESVEHERVVAVLLAAGAGVEATTTPGVATDGFMRDVRTRGERPLHRAAAYGTRGTIRALIDAGATLDARDANGDTPLTWASWALRDADILDLLCFPPHRVRPDRRPMRETLIGRPGSP